MTDITEQSYEFYQNHSKEDCYDFAIELLYRLGRDGFCIWQTYTKDDLKQLGESTKKENMDYLQDQIQNFFVYYDPACAD